MSWKLSQNLESKYCIQFWLKISSEKIEYNFWVKNGIETIESEI